MLVAGSRVMVTPIRVAAILLIVLVCLANSGDKRVQLIGVRPVLTDTEPVEFSVRVPRHPENRLLVIEAVEEGDVDPTSASAYDLDGDSAPLHDVSWHLPSGSYAIVAAVFDAKGEVGRDSKPVTVRGKFD